MIKISDNISISNKLKALFKLDKSPVAIKVFSSEDDAKEVLSKYDGVATHCQMVYMAAHDKKSFYSTVEEQDCMKGASALGLIDQPIDVAHIDSKIEAVGYAPLEDATFDGDVILLYCNVLQTFNFAMLYAQATGKRTKADFAATQGLCSEAFAIPYLTKNENISFGCRGSRLMTDIGDDEVVIGITLDDALSISNFI